MHHPAIGTTPLAFVPHTLPAISYMLHSTPVFLQAAHHKPPHPPGSYMKGYETLSLSAQSSRGTLDRR